MNAKESLLSEIDAIPESLIPEVLNFIQYLRYKHQFTNAKSAESAVSAKETQFDFLDRDRKIETSFLSESLLAKDWLTPEEDEAWQHL